MAPSPLDEPCFLDRTAGQVALHGRTPPGCWAGLYVAGSLAGLAATTVGIVGSRAPSPAGKQLAHRLGTELAEAGLCVISGLALGIDAAAHAGALAAGAPTIGVLGGGHRRFFPRRNRDLALRMIESGGGVLSPYPPDHAAFPSQFLERNGLVAALCDALVVVEAAQRSGALNTAAWAAESGIPVLAFPGDVDRPKVAGCLALIRDGATLVRNGDDVLAALPAHCRPRKRSRARRAASPQMPPLNAALLRFLGDGGQHVDRLIEATDAPAHEVMAALGELELDGWIAVAAGLVAAVRSPPEA